MKEQTAVQWFREKVFFKGSYTGEELRQLFEDALEMEKKQSIELLTKYHDGLFYVPFKDGEAEAIYNHLTNRNESKTNI
jgi:hypothetical protein